MVKHIKLLTQYIKDISFENYSAQKNSFTKEKPKIHIDIKIKKKILKSNCLEITIISLLEAGTISEKLFLIELAYAATFEITDLKNLDEQRRLIFVDCPNIMFPFIRQILFNITRDSGYEAITLDHIDFEGLFNKKMVS